MIPVAAGFQSIVALAVLLLFAHLLRRRSRLIRRYFIPSSLIAGLVALAIGPQVLGALAARTLGPDSALAEGVIPLDYLSVWSAIPGLLITVVFAGLFLGRPMPSLKKLWKVAGAQVVFGQSLAWGQYVVGILLAIFIITPLFGLPHTVGAMIEIGFEGGHGTVAGLEGAFNEFGLEDGREIGMAIATIGIVMSVLVGVMLINWGARTGRISVVDAESPDEDVPEAKTIDPEALGERYDRSSDSFMIHFGVIGIAIILGYGLREALIFIEQTTWAQLGGPILMTHFPLFPLAMIGGLIIQKMTYVIGKPNLLSPVIMGHISGSALDLIIIAAVGTLALDVIGANAGPILILSGGGLAWCLFSFFVLAPLYFRRHKFERGLGDLAQSLGMTVMGLLMLRTVDPEDESRALEGFKYKQLLFEPVVGGGLFTAASIPLIAQIGAWPTLAIVGTVLLGWMFIGIRYVSVLEEEVKDTL